MGKKKNFSYSVHDWDWEWLRRTPQYKRKYKAIERACRRYGNDSKIYNRLRGKLEGQCHLDYLSPPEKPAHEHRHGSPLHTKSVNVIADLNRERLYTPSDRTERLKHILLTEGQLTVRIDPRFNANEIVGEIRQILRNLRNRGVLDKAGEKRNRSKLFKDYLAVHDLGEEGYNTKEIARILWPKEYEKDPERKDVRQPTMDYDRPRIIQKVYDYINAADKLIKEAFPLRKHLSL